MSRSRFHRPPAYCRHKASGQAVVRIQGRDIYLGTYGSTASHEKYERAIAEWRAGVSSTAEKSPAGNALTVNDVLLQYAQFAADHYVDPDGQRSKEFKEMMLALRPVRNLYGRSRMADFGPKALKAVQAAMAATKRLSRAVINHRINRIRRFIRWAVSEELAPPELHAAVKTVQPLRRGQLGVRDKPPVAAVPLEHVQPVMNAASPQIAAMIQLQLLGGMRPGEVTRLRASEIDRTGEVWLYRPARHKNLWRGKQRSPIFLGPECQEILAPFLDGRDPAAYCFSPVESEAWRSRKRREARKSNMTPSQRQRRPKRRPKRPKRDSYDVDSYRRAVKYVLAKVNRQRSRMGHALIPEWCPAQLRHTRATEVRQKYGIEAAQVFLGHERADVTQIYADRDLELARRVARDIG